MRVEAVPQALVRGYVTMRHNALLDRCAELEAELFELRALVSGVVLFDRHSLQTGLMEVCCSTLV